MLWPGDAPALKPSALLVVSIQYSSSAHQSPLVSVRCSHAGGDNPQWKVNNRTRLSGLAKIRLMGPGFSVISLDWARAQVSSLTLECFTSSCKLRARAVRPDLRPASSTTTTSKSRWGFTVILIDLSSHQDYHQSHPHHHHLHHHHQVQHGPRVRVLGETERTRFTELPGDWTVERSRGCD